MRKTNSLLSTFLLLRPTPIMLQVQQEGISLSMIDFRNSDSLTNHQNISIFPVSMKIGGCQTVPSVKARLYVQTVNICAGRVCFGDSSSTTTIISRVLLGAAHIIYLFYFLLLLHSSFSPTTMWRSQHFFRSGPPALLITFTMNTLVQSMNSQSLLKSDLEQWAYCSQSTKPALLLSFGCDINLLFHILGRKSCSSPPCSFLKTAIIYLMHVHHHI
mmetsp:Transcript_5108/g.8762  ORF Transcript_5108/g.8762 Transcript_5108/m.8762 type:complete len:216 (+) Transcript_5108:469-1116(+)